MARERVFHRNGLNSVDQIISEPFASVSVKQCQLLPGHRTDRTSWATGYKVGTRKLPKFEGSFLSFVAEFATHEAVVILVPGELP